MSRDRTSADRAGSEARFRYLRDPVFLCACAAYVLARFLRGAHPLVHDHLTDFLLIPCALPVLLGIQRLTGLRRDDRIPGAGEVALYCAVWALLFELVFPRWWHRGVADFGDVLAYAAGAVAAWLAWRAVYRAGRQPLTARLRGR